MMSWTQCF